MVGADRGGQVKRLGLNLKVWIRSWALRLWPIAVLALLCVAFFWDVFFLRAEQILGGDDLTNLFWHWADFAVSSIEQGRFPLWNPYLFSGIPFSANPQPALFYPPMWLTGLMPLNRALALIVVLHVWVAGGGMYAWMRSEGASKSGALFAAAVFAFSGYFLVRIRGGHLGVLTTGSWLPLLLWIYRSVCRRQQWALALAGGLPVGLSILAGHMASFIYVALGLTAYAAYGAWKAWQREQSIHAVTLRLVWVCTMLAVGLAVAAVQLLPAAELARQSTRQAGANYDFAARFSWPPGHLLTLLVPNFFGEATHTGYWSEGIYDEFVFYIGIMPLMLGLIGLKLQHRLRDFLALTALGALLLAFGEYSILHRLFYRFVPLFRVMRAPARAGYLFTLAAAALAGLTMTTLQRSDRQDRARLLGPFRWSWVMTVTGGVLVLIVAGFAAFALGREATPAAGRLWHQANQTMLFLIFFLLSASVLIWWKRAPSAQAGFYVSALVLVLLDLWTFGNGILKVRNIQESAYWRIVAEAVPDAETRVLPWGLNEAEQNGAMAYDVQSVFGYDPLTLQRYEEFITSRPDPRARTYDLLNAGYLVTTAPQGFPEEPGEPQLLLEQSGVTIYKRPGSLPRAWIVRQLRVMDDAAILEHIHEPAFDPRATALVEAPTSCPGTGGQVKITEYSGNGIEAQTEGGGGLLVLSEIHYPGWKATVDGEPAELVRADYLLRALCVPPGTHQIDLRYDPPLLKLGLLITAVALLLVAAASIWILREPADKDGR